MIGWIACHVQDCFRNDMVPGGSKYYLQYVFSQFPGLLCPYQSGGFCLRGSSITHSSGTRQMSGNLAKPCEMEFLCCSAFCHGVKLSKAAILILLRAPALWSNVCPSETAARKFEIAGEYGAGILKSNMTALLSCLKDRIWVYVGGTCGLAEYQVLFHSLPSGKN